MLIGISADTPQLRTKFLDSLTRLLPTGSNITITSILAYYNDGTTSNWNAVSTEVGRRRELGTVTPGDTTGGEGIRRELKVLYGVDVNYIVSTPR